MKNKAVFILVVVLLFSFGFVWVFNNKKENSESKKIKIAVTIYPLEYLVSSIGGDRVNVDTIVPAGVEPHDFEPTARDLSRVMESDVLVVVGGKFDSWINGLIPDMQKKGIELIDATDILSASGSVLEKDGQIDPHVWLSPSNMKQIAQKIDSVLMTRDPVGRDQYEIRFDRLQNDLNLLDQAYRSGLEDCQRRQFITSHAAFSYLAKDYGLEQLPIAGLEPEAEPTSRQLAELAKQAKEGGINYIFFEEMVSPKLAETLANEVGAATLVLNPLESLSPRDKSVGNNYYSEMINNLSNLRLALECK